MFAWLQSIKTPPFLARREKKSIDPSSILSYVAPLVMGDSSGGYEQFSKEGYKKNVIAHRCISMIARSVAGVSWMLYDKEEKLTAHPFLDLWTKPNPSQGGKFLIESLVSYLLLSGNAYLEIFFDQGKPVELYALRPDRVRIHPHRTSCSYEYKVGSTSRRIMGMGSRGRSSLFHIKFFNPLDDWYGMSPLEAAIHGIHFHNTILAHNLALLQNGGRPCGALMAKPKNNMPLTEEQRQQLKEDLQDIYQGTKNAGRMMVLEGDFEWKEMGLSPKDLDFFKGKNLAAREISQAFGVPPMLVGIQGDATFSNYREARLHLWEDTILPLLDVISHHVTTWILPFFGPSLNIRYDKDNISALSLKREALWNRVNGCDFLTLNEKRQSLGYAPLPGGDGLTAH